MQPEQSINPTSQPTINPSDNMPPRNTGKHFSRKQLVIGGSVLVVLALIGGLAIIFMKHKANTTTSEHTNNSDAMILQSNPIPVKYGGSNVIQACNIIPQPDLNKAGYRFDTGSGPNTFYRSYFTGEGTQNIKFGDLGLSDAGSADTNSCKYLLSNEMSVITAVYQSSYILGGSFSDYVANHGGQSQPDIDGMKVWKFVDKTTNNNNYAIISTDGQTGVDVSFEEYQHNQNPNTVTQKEQTFVTIAASNLVAQSKKQTGAPILTYSQNAFPASIASACSLTNSNDFKSIFGVDSSPLVTENAGNPGTTTFAGSSTVYSYVDNLCYVQPYIDIASDATTSAEYGYNLTVQTESYLTAAPAKDAFAVAYQSAKGASSASGIGDEAFFAAQSGNLQSPLVLRKGRFIVEVSPSQPSVPAAQDSQQIVRELTPIGKKIAAELKQ